MACKKPVCACMPQKPCFETIEKLLGHAKETPSQPKDKRSRDLRDPALDEIPTVQCGSPEQKSSPASYPGAPCSQSHGKKEDNQNTERRSNQDPKPDHDQNPDTDEEFEKVKRKLIDEASKCSCPCKACGKDALAEECVDPFIEYERRYISKLRSKQDDDDMDQLPHDSGEKGDRSQDQALCGTETDSVPQPCPKCPCCLAFSPYPPATLATPDLYRTCGLPKRFRYPSWFKGYGLPCQHPLYRTTNAEFGKYPPSVHTVPTVYNPSDRSYSNSVAKMGPYRDRGLRTTGSIWDAYTYFDFH